MTRAIRISLNLATARKRRRLVATLQEMRAAVNFYTRLLCREGGGWNRLTERKYTGGRLLAVHRTGALHLAVQAVRQLDGKKGRVPVFRRAVRFNHMSCRVERGRGSFDYVLKITSLVPYKQIVIPFKSHQRLNHWLSQPGAELRHGAIISENCAWIYVRVPDGPPQTSGPTLGLDIGLNCLITDSDGHQHGTNIKAICAKVRRRRPGSKRRRQSVRERKHYVNAACRQLPWSQTKTFVLEDLTGLKVGKGRRGKRNRKLLAPWSYREVRQRIEHLAQENRVQLAFVDPAGTSRTCPACGLENEKNRVSTNFDCVQCHYKQNADYVGAINVLSRMTGNCLGRTVPDRACGKSPTVAASTFKLDGT